MSREATPRMAFFRPDDERREAAEAIINAKGGEPVADPMLAFEGSGATPRTDADFVVFTSATAAKLIQPERFADGTPRICAIGDATAGALRAIDLTVDVVPDTATSAGLVEALAPHVTGDRVEIARSDAGSDVLPAGLNDAGAYVHETVLYTIERPSESGRSIDQLLTGDLDALLFTSTLTVDHFLEAAAERSRERTVRESLKRVVVGAIGPPTARTLEDRNIAVDIVASDASFETLASEVFEEL